MGESFWQKDSLITHILFELWLIMIFSPVANFAQHSLCYLLLCFTFVCYLSTLSVLHKIFSKNKKRMIDFLKHLICVPIFGQITNKYKPITVAVRKSKIAVFCELTYYRAILRPFLAPVFPRIVLFWIWPDVLWQKLFKGGNYSWKYGIFSPITLILFTRMSFSQSFWGAHLNMYLKIGSKVESKVMTQNGNTLTISNKGR